MAAQPDRLTELWAEFARDDTEFVERIQELYEHPVNLNTADKNELLSVPLFTVLQADSILALRKRLGGFRSKRQIRSILGAEYYELTKAFFTTRSRLVKNGAFIHKNYFSLADESAPYPGPNYYDYNKLYYEINDRLRFGLISQKDPGESSFFDYFTGYVRYRGSFFKLIAGSYKLEFGEGLTYSDPFGQQKSSMAVVPFASAINGARPTLSSAENVNQFGVFGELQGFSLFRWQVFYAANRRDALMDDKGQIIIGMDYDGYHRTPREIASAGQINEQIWGSALTMEIGNRLSIGALASRTHYSPSIQFNKKTVRLNEWRRKYYTFHGEQLNNFSFFYTAQWERLFFSGEYAISGSRRPAYAQTVFLQIDPLKIGFKFWHLDKNYQAPYGRVFDDRNPFPRADEGFYLGLTYSKKRFRFNFYRLFKKELWRSYFYPLPRQGAEWLAQADYRFERADVMLRYRNKQGERFISEATGNSARIQQKQDIYYAQGRFKPASSLRLTTRFTHTVLHPFTEKGTALYQDLEWRILPAMQFNFRISFYRTDSYDSRIYEYETDLPGSFANYALYGEGYKWYVRVRWDLMRFFSLWCKFRYAYLQDALPAVFKYRPTGRRLDRGLRIQIQFKF